MARRNCGCVVALRDRQARYISASPSSREMRGCQPSDRTRCEPRTFRGVPSGLVGSKRIRPRYPDDTGNQTREIGYRNFETRPDIHRLATHMTPEQKHHRIRQIVDVEEFPERLSRAPKLHGFRPGLFGFVHPAHESGDDVRVLRVEIVVRAVEVAGHYREKLLAMLAAVGFRQLESGDLGD